MQQRRADTCPFRPSTASTFRTGTICGMAITYLRGDATDPHGSGPRFIVHVCNDVGTWGAGFVKAVSARWPQPEAAYRRWHRTGRSTTGAPFTLGQIEGVPVAEKLWVVNLIGQHGLARPGYVPVRYDAIADGLRRSATAAVARGASVHMPRIGCGLAGGTWEEVEPIIDATLTEAGVEVFVYDL